jgi:SAM-dependent methyltransferase
VPPPRSAYWLFYRDVAAAQLAAWLPDRPARVLDLSGPAGFAAELVTAGHEVVLVREHAADAAVDADGPGRVLPVLADSRSLSWLAPGSVDLVLAESRVLSMCLAAEVTAEQLAAVLRPGGRLLLTVDSLSLGLARLADQGRWAELADVPSADVVLVPGRRRLDHPVLLAGGARGAAHRRGPGRRLGAPAVGAQPGDGRARARAGRTRRAPDARRDRGRPGAGAAGRGDRPPPRRERPPPLIERAGRAQPPAASNFSWSTTQRAASGRTSSRASGICWPQSTHVP